MALDPKFKARWVEALRSGAFDQTQGTLRDNNGFCCLGVACNIIDHNRWAEENKWGEFFYEFPTGEKASADWSKEFCDSVGLPYNTMDLLTQMNDNGSTFEAIADFIEDEL